MTPLPKRKLSKGARNRRRSHLALSAKSLAICPSCKSAMRPHHVCPECGKYRGVEVIDMEAKTAKKKTEK
ncbi:MAG TPA: 50S ribosomal protein L32 [Anaerolineae bacterium]|nr:50S ribosomal protein L32 [Anaerolineae bacterium]